MNQNLLHLGRKSNPEIAEPQSQNEALAGSSHQEPVTSENPPRKRKNLEDKVSDFIRNYDWNPIRKKRKKRNESKPMS